MGGQGGAVLFFYGCGGHSDRVEPGLEAGLGGVAWVSWAWGCTGGGGVSVCAEVTWSEGRGVFGLVQGRGTAGLKGG